MQYIALIHDNTVSPPRPQEWEAFFEAARETGMFRGGSAIGARRLVGNRDVVDSTATIGGFMRFDSDDLERVLELLDRHPVVRNGGSVELCEMPRS